MEQENIQNLQKTTGTKKHTSRYQYPVKETLRLTSEDADRCAKDYAAYVNPRDPTKAGFLRHLIRLGLNAAEMKSTRR